MERLWSEILEIRRSVFGEEYPPGTINGLGVALCHLGKYEEAERFFTQTLKAAQAWPETNPEGFKMHPYLWRNLCRVYTARGQYAKAEELLRKSIRGYGWDVEYGVNLRYSTELANVYREWGKYDKAEALFDKTLNALRQIKGDEHFLTILCMYGLVRFYVDQSRFDEAETLFIEALPIARRRLREDHPVLLRFVHARALLHCKQQQYAEAESMFKEALQGRQRELGQDHPDTLESKHDLGVLYTLQARYQDAESLLLETFQGRNAKLGSNHPHALDTIENMVRLYEAWDKPAEARVWQDKLLKLGQLLQPNKSDNTPQAQIQ
jgi:tetratricopeptide (TPR) repeat protein